MDKKTEGLYLGIDINDRYTMLSFYQRHMDEPETVSTVMGKAPGRGAVADRQRGQDTG